MTSARRVNGQNQFIDRRKNIMDNAEAAQIIQKFNEHHTYSSVADCLFVEKLYELDFTAVQTALIIKLLDETCLHCFNAEKPCRCWDDS